MSETANWLFGGKFSDSKAHIGLLGIVAYVKDKMEGELEMLHIGLEVVIYKALPTTSARHLRHI
jgi:hypothetical protein